MLASGSVTNGQERTVPVLHLPPEDTPLAWQQRKRLNDSIPSVLELPSSPRQASRKRFDRKTTVFPHFHTLVPPISTPPQHARSIYYTVSLVVHLHRIGTIFLQQLPNSTKKAAETNTNKPQNEKPASNEEGECYQVALESEATTQKQNDVILIDNRKLYRRRYMVR